MARSAQLKASPRKGYDVPVMVGTGAAVVLFLVGAFAGFDALGTLGPVSVLVLVAVLCFLVGAALTVRRIMAMREPASRKD